MNYITSFNIIKQTIKNSEVINRTLLNKYPILFHSNTGNTFHDELIENQQLYKVLSDLSVFDYLSYTNTVISGIKFDIDTKKYSEEDIDVQELFKLEKIKEGRKISLDIIYYICNKMYTRAQGDPNNLTEDIEKNISLICKYLETTYPADYSKEGIINLLVVSTRLNKENVEYLTSVFDEII